MTEKAFLGIDVSKGYADFLLLGSQNQVLEKNFQLLDTKAGRQDLAAAIKSWRAAGLKELFCGVESTGGYENNWYQYLKGLQSQGGLYVSRLNPRAVKAVSDAVLRRTITDAVSAENIASYLLKFPEKVDYNLHYTPKAEYAQGRQYLSYIRMQQKQKVQLSNQLEKLLYQNFPEVLIYCRNRTPLWLLEMLVKYPTAEKVIKAGKRLEKIPYITPGKAEALIKKARQNENNTSELTSQLISKTADEVLHKERIIAREKKYVTGLYKDLHEVKLIDGVPGIGPDSAVHAVLEIEEISRFNSSKKIVSYFGIHPTYKQSGDGSWGHHMSKAGRSEMRAMLYMCALTAIREDPFLKGIYTRARDRGMNHNQAAGVIMHKLLRIIYGILKSKKPYNKNQEQEDLEKAKEKKEAQESQMQKKKKESNQKRNRYQIISKDAICEAPLSSRNARKRKKQAAAQASLEENAGLLPADANI